MESERLWCGRVADYDDFGHAIEEAFIDGVTVFGPWAIMSPESHALYGRGLGTGRGQRYTLQGDGRWLKTEG